MSPMLMEPKILEPVDHEVAVCENYNEVGPVSPIMALRELYELLEEYAPMWYPEAAHDRARAALGRRNVC